MGLRTAFWFWASALTRLSRQKRPESCGIPASSTTARSRRCRWAIRSGVTPLQMVSAISSVANGGDLMQPRVVHALIRDGRRTEVKPTVLGRTISKDTAATLTSIMEQTVERGTATFAQVEGYTIAGKDGHGSETGERPLLAYGLLRVVCRLSALAKSGRQHHRGDRLSARAWVLRRSDCRVPYSSGWLKRLCATSACRRHSMHRRRFSSRAVARG